MANEGTMTWREFQKWCNERACDGLWGYKECEVCVAILRLIRSLPFWKRKHMWKLIAPTMLEKIIHPTNQKIREMRRKNSEQVQQALDELVGGKSCG